MNDSTAAPQQVLSHGHARRSATAASIAIALLSPCMAQAQDNRSVAELEAEMARLQQLLEQKRQAQSTANAAAEEATAATSESASAAPKERAQIEGVLVTANREVNRREDCRTSP